MLYIILSFPPNATNENETLWDNRHLSETIRIKKIIFSFVCRNRKFIKAAAFTWKSLSLLYLPIITTPQILLILTIFSQKVQTVAAMVVMATIVAMAQASLVLPYPSLECKHWCKDDNQKPYCCGPPGKTYPPVTRNNLIIIYIFS